MNATRRVTLLFSAILVVLFASPLARAQCVSLTTLASPYNQNFDALSNTAGSTTNELPPVVPGTLLGWDLTETGGGARDNEQYAVDTGGSNTGDTFSYGATAATDRALGGLQSGTLIPVVGACFTNNTGGTVTNLDIGYTGEEWRLGTITRTDQINFEFSTDATNLATGTWTGVAALNFVTPNTATPTGAKDGNAAGFRTVISPVNIPALSIANGATFWIRWIDANATGADDGLSVDDFSLTPQGAVALPNLTVTDVTQAETNAGTTIFGFQVNLSAPAGPGGVTFDIATADGTAQDDNPAVSEDNDYVAQSLLAQNIPMGSTGPFAFNVTVNGDVVPEVNEDFFVNVSNITGATPTDTQGLGTITNDDVACATISINDVSQVETNGGTTTFAFTVSLSQAGCGTVTFDIATQDNSATTADNDYVVQTLIGQTITFPSTYTFNVTVNGDVTTEPDQTFFVNLTNVSPANVQVGDPQGLGTIVNDDFTRIHDIQGAGATSPLAGVVTTRGIVTGRKSNGYFIQEPDASIDVNPLTSEGVFVFTSAAPPAAAAIGNLVEVTGTISEFSPSADPLQPPLTELTTPTTVQLSTGNPLPAAIPLTATFPDPTGVHDQLERVESMRVSVASLTVGGPTLGNVNEPNATATSTGVFYGTVTGVPRAFREAGIQDPDPAPSGGGTIPPIPRYDSNPEVIRVDDGLTGAPTLDVSTGAVVTGLIGPLDYGFRKYTILPEPAPTAAPVVVGGFTPTVVTTPTAREFTVGAYNLERFFDYLNDPGIGEPVLTAGAFDIRLNKASLGIRNNLKNPDVIGIVEIENLATLQDLAARISSDAIAASQPDPLYFAYLTEGNDVGGIDVGFLVKTAVVTGATPRVTVNAVVQENAGELFVNPDTSTSLLNDRPSLRLDAVINHANGATFPVTVIVNHLRSLNGSTDETAGSNGWATDGLRIRAKRQKQAESLANLVQARQIATPAERIILVGDFNAFEFNDGLGDSMNVITGTPTPDNQTAVPGDGVDLVNPDLDNLFDTAPAAERYSFVFDGNAQSLDHVVVNTDLISSTLAQRLEHPRINADFAAIDRNNFTTALRLADHDPVVGFFEVAAFAVADLVVTKTDSPDPVNAGANLTYTITVTNNGPDAAATASWSDTLPTGTTFVSLPAVAGWSCTTPSVGAAGTVSCTNPSFAVGSSVFTLTVAVDPSVAAGTVLTNNATVTSTTTDGSSGNETGTATTTVATSADLSITKVDTPDPVLAGNNITYTIGLSNTGPSDAAGVTFSDTIPANTTFVSLTSFADFSCTTPAVGGTGAINCSKPSLFVAGSSGNFTLVVNVNPGTANGTIISNTATAASTTPDPSTGNESATATSTVSVLSADLSVTKTDSPDPVTAGTNLTYTITVNNAGPDTAGATLDDTLPANTSFVSLASPGGWSCTTPAVGAGGLVQCQNASMTIGNAVFTLTVAVDANAGGGTTLSNTATVTSTVSDPSPGNESDTEDTTVISPATLSATKTASGTLSPGSTVTYTIVISNAGPAAQTDNPGDELVDVLPSQLTLISANATSGTAVATIGTNTVTWNGAIPAAGSVTITIQALIEANVPVGTTITNQGTINYDADGNGTNEASAVTDDPSQGGSGDTTGFVVAPATLADVPALDGFALAALAALLAGLGLLVVRRS